MRSHKFNFFKKPKKAKLKKGEKLPPKKSGSVRKIAGFLRSGRSFRVRPDRFLQEIFSLAAVAPFISDGLIQPDDLTAAGDGTCLPVPSSHFSIKDCDGRFKGIWGCQCDCRYSNPDANGGGTVVRNSGSMDTPSTYLTKRFMWISLYTFALSMPIGMTASRESLAWLNPRSSALILPSKISSLTQHMTTIQLTTCAMIGISFPSLI